MNLDMRSLQNPAILARVPIFLVALLIVRAIPALFYRPLAQRPAQLVAAGLLQATSLSIPVVAGRIGVDLGLIPSGNYAALVAAGLLSVLVFPLLATPKLRPAAADSSWVPEAADVPEASGVAEVTSPETPVRPPADS